MDVKEIDILGDEINTHWYYISKAKALLKFIKSKKPYKIMDVGAGSGYFSKFLLSQTSADEAWCVDISYSKDSDLLESNKPIHFLRSMDKTNVDLVLLMDVLEHVDDDIGLLSEYVNKVPVGTKFIISVPAFNWLWSSHDDFLEHKRRYTIRQIENTVKKSGLTIHKSCYYFSLVLPLAIVTRLALKFKNTPSTSQLKKHGVLTNKILKKICSLDRIFFLKNRIAGLTVFCYAEKK